MPILSQVEYPMHLNLFVHNLKLAVFQEYLYQYIDAVCYHIGPPPLSLLSLTKNILHFLGAAFSAFSFNWWGL